MTKYKVTRVDDRSSYSKTFESDDPRSALFLALAEMEKGSDEPPMKIKVEGSSLQKTYTYEVKNKLVSGWPDNAVGEIVSISVVPNETSFYCGPADGKWRDPKNILPVHGEWVLGRWRYADGHNIYRKCKLSSGYHNWCGDGDGVVEAPTLWAHYPKGE